MRKSKSSGASRRTARQSRFARKFIEPAVSACRCTAGAAQSCRSDISCLKCFLMRLPNPLLLAALYGLSELFLALTRHSRTQAVSRDRRSLFILWTVIIVSLWLGIQMIWLFPRATVPYPRGFYFL